MTLEILEEGPSRLSDYATVPIRFEVAEVFDARAIEQLRRGEQASPVAIRAPYVKDYDGYAGHHPKEWPTRFDVSDWSFLAAYSDSRRVGGAVVAVADPRLELVGESPELALLWDLRVAPEMRGRGVGSALVTAAEHAAARRGARALRVETQQVNVAACRLYQRHGFSLDRISPDAYPSLPDEIQLLWSKSIGSHVSNQPPTSGACT